MIYCLPLSFLINFISIRINACYDKIVLKINTDVTVLSFNSIRAHFEDEWFKCHLELLLPSPDYGFGIYMEEMSLSGNTGDCTEDWVQFGRDILFFTTYKSNKYCGVF